MYATLLTLHNIARWILIVSAVILIVKTILNLVDKAPWHNLLDRAMRWYTITIDMQLLIGLVIMFAYSPMTTSAFTQFGIAMHNPVMRFFTLIHPLLMIGALVLAHVGRSQVKKEMPDKKKYLAILLWFGLSLALLLLAIPWPYTYTARLLIRLLDLAW
jgi:Na+/H+ antiporter NhaB